MPASTCGTWPACEASYVNPFVYLELTCLVWVFNNQENGTNWPEGGEIEIIEGANTVQRNLYSAHT